MYLRQRNSNLENKDLDWNIFKPTKKTDISAILNKTIQDNSSNAIFDNSEIVQDVIPMEIQSINIETTEYMNSKQNLGEFEFEKLTTANYELHEDHQNK
jgi:hypothetical protein